MGEPKLKVKKVTPYPIDVTITTTTGPVPGKILHLEVKGFIADIGAKIMKVGDLYQAQFEIPVLKAVIAHTVRVIKTKDLSIEGVVQRTAEFHFGPLAEEEKRHIYSFLRAIRQIDPID